MKLVIIDGKSVFYRGYYAMGNLSKKDGTPTGGVYGFATIAMELVKEIHPDKVVVAWDKAKTSTAKRKAIFADYKAGRVKPPEDFYAQIPTLQKFVEDLGWGFLECDEYEADDIIGTLARQATKDNVDNEVIIVSSDLDMLQIVDERIKMYRLLKGFSDLEEMDVAAVEAKYGILKSQFLDLKALKGDMSDNIPGVPGVGEKSAVKLLNEYGTLEGVYENIDNVRGSLRDKLVTGEESAKMSKQLAQIMFDAPVDLVEVPDLKVDAEHIIAVLNDLEFYSLVRKFRKEFNLSSKSELKNSAQPLDDGKALPEGLIVREDIKRAMHDDEALANEILEGAEIWDVNQARFLLDPLERKTDEKNWQGRLSFDSDDERRYLEREYWEQQEKYAKLPKLRRVLTELDLAMIPVLYKMEKRGLKISRTYFEELRQEYTAQVNEIEKAIFAEAGMNFNINSPIQLSHVLYEELQLPTKGVKKTARGYSTGAKELERLRGMHPIVGLLMEYREASKLLSTYITPLPNLADGNGRIHTTFTQDVTATGRLSSTSPNLQNIPVRTEEGKRIRKGFVADDGKVFVSADYAQFELRLAAVLSGDQQLIDDFNSGVDIHTKTAADVFKVPFDEVKKEQRRAAKVINFGVLYGMSAKGLSEAAGMNVNEARDFIEEYFEVRKPIREYLDRILVQAREMGYVETYFGRRRPTPDVKSSNFLVRASAERAAQNMPIQGTEADLMKLAMIRVAKRLPKGAELVLQVHDSLIVECDEELEQEVRQVLVETMEGVAPELKIKLAVEVTSGKDWGEL